MANRGTVAYNQRDPGLLTLSREMRRFEMEDLSSRRGDRNRSPKERRAAPRPVFRSVASPPTPEVAPRRVTRGLTATRTQARTPEDTSPETRCALAECSRQFVLPAGRIRVAPAFSLRG